jgi:hypothetical protein
VGCFTEHFHTNMMYIKKNWIQGLLSKGTGFGTTARLQVARACS